ncbi:MAG: REP-associated tyrosine transposase [Hyphomicrobiales bacterium]|jgi:REP element-mobilizing transposase RayT|nr:REP-associated tyrosine transposase [Hyphomicrobiales bacterium]
MVGGGVMHFRFATQVDALRAAVRITRDAHPFTIDAVVVLPDHLHIVMTLPAGDADFSNRSSLIKRRFTAAVARTGVRTPRHLNGEHAPWQRRFWDTPSAMRRISSVTSTTSTSIRSSTASSRAYATGRIHRFTITCGVGYCLRIGPAISGKAAEIR